MLQSLHVISGLVRRSSGETIFIDALKALGIDLSFNSLYDKNLLTNTLEHLVVVVILPILGDNDLTDEVRNGIAKITSLDSYRKCSIVVVAQGDRHESDEFVTRDTPFSIKVRHLFSCFGNFELLEKKLDQFTATALASEIYDYGNATNIRDVFELNRLTQILSRAPKWLVRKRLLDFYDPYSGVSLLKHIDRAELNCIAAHIQTISPQILKITHAALNDGALDELGDALNANVLDLGSNNFSWDRLLPQLSQCRWLNLAANSLTQIQLPLLSQNIEQLYLHKNDICEFTATLGHVERLKSLSIYRNQLEIFDWPAGQTMLENLNLGANPITSLPDTLSDCVTLRRLGLARTRLSTLPEWLFSMPNLHEIDISYIENQIPATQLSHLRAQRVSLITRPGLIL